MSSYNTRSVKLSANRSTQVAKQLRIALENSTLVRAAQADLTVTADDLAALEECTNAWTPELRTAVAILSPAEHKRAREAVAQARALSSQQANTARAEIARQIADAKAELAQALQLAQRRIDNAIAETTAQAMVTSAQELGYRVTRRKEGDTTAIDMRRDHEIVLAVVRGETVAIDHAGLSDSSCLQRQQDLVEEIRSRGIELAEGERDDHRDDGGGKLIRAAVAGQSSLLSDPGAFAQTAARQHEHKTAPPPAIRPNDIGDDLDGPRIQA
ncbi:hypothetical protein ACFXHA_03310 [Nocardia sp. NPDC059240]|uniref:hypothetical protein n=1 Tax=Nocardia sp. NPDC059240 TaxID=3346786 RepID=UPI00367A9F54